MDAASRSRGNGGGRRAARGQKRPDDQNERSRDGRRLLQLLVSLALFLLVYIGRGVFPGQVEVWRAALTSDVDFQAAFQEFGQAVSEGETVQEAFQTLCVTVFGGTVEDEGPEDPASQPDKIVFLTDTPRIGLTYLEEHGALAGKSEQSGGEDPAPPETVTPVESEEPVVSAEPEPTGSVEPEPTETVVTAIAQEYNDAGIKLPSNVSMAYYPLGLEKTIVPVNGTVTSTFGYRDSPINGNNEFHLALDIGAAEGTEIGAFADGVVRYIGTSDEFGNYLMIDHDNNVSTFYAHCSKLLVRKGDVVTCGQTVALVGHTGNATGPHLHLTILKDDIRLDPAYYVDLS